jgi:hypothetical protein
VNPYAPLIALLAILGAGVGGFFYGGHVREAEIVAKQSRDADLIRETREAAALGAADAIAKIEVKHVTVREKTEVQLRDNPIYRDCVADDRLHELVNEAITGETRPADSGLVPAAGSDGRPVIR